MVKVSTGTVKIMSWPWLPLVEKHIPQVTGKQANDRGWVSVNCLLHPDNKQTAGVSLDSGMYLCHNDSCAEASTAAVGRAGKGKWIRFPEFLHLLYGWTILEAQHVVEAYRVGHLETLFAHDDAVSKNGNGKSDTSTLDFFSVEVEAFVKDAHARLAENFDDIDIAIDYAYARGLTQETLYETGVGYVPPRTQLPDDSWSGHSGCLIFPYWFKNRLVGVRIRQGDSRKRMLLNSHYVPFNINDVFNTTSRTIAVGEGESDTLRLRQALHEAGITNVPVVGTPGVNFDRTWTRFLQRFNRVVIVPQADAPSQDKFVKSLKLAFGQRTDVVQIPWEEDALGGKDVCDYLLMQPAHAHDLVELLSLSDHDIEDRPYVKSRAYFESRQDKEIDWLIPNVIERGSKCLILGEPKVGKTFIILDFINAAIHGTAPLGMTAWAPEHFGLRCLLIEEEGSERAMGKRILSLIAPTDLLGVIHGENIKLDDEASFLRLRQEVAKFKPDLVVFDPYASLHNQNENEVQGTGLVLDALNAIYRANPQCTIIVVHHTGVTGEKRARGSSALWGAMDSQIVVQKDSGNTISVTIRGREIEDSDPHAFEFDPDTKQFTPILGTSIKIVSHKAVDQDLAQDIEALLGSAGQPLTHQQIADSLKQDYNAVRTCLLALTGTNRVARTGSGGRKGYLYALLPSSAP